MSPSPSASSLKDIADSRSSGEDKRRILRKPHDPYLFRPFEVRSVTARNHIMLSPMCQYCGEDGMPNEWHYIHLAARAIGGAGIVCTEVIHTQPHGRISPGCLGIWTDDHRDALARIVTMVEEHGAVPAMQIGHAGRKAAVTRPWEGSLPIQDGPDAWDTVSSSAIPFSDGWRTPEELDQAGIDEVVESFRVGTRRAREAGFKLLEIHGAHGYLINQFYNPFSNKRDDDYGGDFENRCRFLFETIDAVRSEWPDDLPLFLRISATDWLEGGWGVEDSVRLAKILKEKGQVDLIDCSSAGTSPEQKVPIHPGYQVPLAKAVKDGSGMMTGAVGLIHTPEHAESILANGDADLVIMGRTLLGDPYWPLKAAKVLKAETVEWPVQYERANIF